MHPKECSLCCSQSSKYYCASCTNDLLQQRRTLLQALKADVSVLRKKTECAMSQKLEVCQKEEEKQKCMQKVAELTSRVLKIREILCSKRLQVVEKLTIIENRTMRLEKAHEDFQKCSEDADHVNSSILQSLDLESKYVEKDVARAKRMKIKQLFQVFNVFEQESAVNASDLFHGKPCFRSIVSLPIPISGHFDIVPSKIMAAAFGKIIHLLLCLTTYLQIDYPHRMVFHGSFSTIGDQQEGKDINVLYPDGSTGFECGVKMLYENIAYVCTSQGIAPDELHETDMLGNLLKLAESKPVRVSGDV